ncbi:hypothetical protein ACFO4O_04375 [Glaciecola siphonariae]|uniref:Tip attachment protein J domain-containing protein n=1 Tax=Glaciecola siphonariae TaxID=521012 RepID=A0ABV9LTB0_9ALTE
MSFFSSLFGIEEPAPPLLSVSEKPKTDSALDFVVGSDYVKIEGVPIFKRLNEEFNEVGLVMAWCTGPILGTGNSVAGNPGRPNPNDPAAGIYVGDRFGYDSDFRFNPGSAEVSELAFITPQGTPSGFTSNWTDFINRFGWQPNTMKGKGICHSFVKYTRNVDVFQTDPSTNMWLKARKKNVRDTAGRPNGLNDAWANNPFAVIKWYIFDSIVGMNKPLTMFGSSFQESIDWLEDNLVTQDGEQRKRFTVNGTLSTAEEYKKILEEFENHCFSKISFIEGKFEIRTKGRTTTPFIDFNSSNLVGTVEVKPASAFDAFTQVEVSWINPDKNFEKDFVIFPETDSVEHLAALQRANYIENIEDFKLPLCNNHFEAYEYARIKYFESVDKVDVRFTAHAEASQVLPYDVISITDPKRTWNGKLFLVEKIEEKDSNGVELYEIEATAFNPTIYNWSGAGVYTPIPTYDGRIAKIPAPQNLTWNNAQRALTWDKPATTSEVIKYHVYVNDKFVGETVSTNYQLDLPDSSYAVAVFPLNLFNQGISATLNLTIGPLVTPDYTPIVSPGYITITPPELVFGFYEYRHGVLDDFAESEAGSPDGQFRLFNTAQDQTYYFWVRYNTGSKASPWLKKSAVGKANNAEVWQIFADDDQATNPSLTDANKPYIGLAFGFSVPLTSLSQISDYTIFKTWITNSASRWLIGTGAPAAALGSVGQSYVDDDTSDVYIKTDTGWVLVGNFGTGDGDTFLSGTTDPVDSLGLNGATYLNLTSKELFKKIGGTWVTQGNLRGPQGPQGIPGAKGENGVQLFTWIKYADNANGAGLSNFPAGKEYIGFAYNKTTATESNNAADYLFSKIVGEEGVQGNTGVQGPPGPNGESLYTWIKYSANSDGTGLTDLPQSNSIYIGIAVNKTVASESNNKADYVWSRYRGEAGPQGVAGPQGPSGTTTYTWIRYATSSTGANSSNNPTGKTHIGFAYNKTSPIESTDPSQYTWSLMQGPTGSTGPQGPQGPQGNTGVQGPDGPDGRPSYTWIKYSANADGTGLTDSPQANTKYIGISPNQTLAAESNNKADYTWSLFVGEDGAQGPQGPIGPPGAPGADSPTQNDDDDSGSGSGNSNNQWNVIAAVNVPSGLGNFTVSVSASASSYAQTGGAEPLDRPTTTTLQAIRTTGGDSLIASNSQAVDSGLFSGVSLSGSWTVGSGTYLIRAKFQWTAGDVSTRGITYSGSIRSRRQ